MGSLSNEGLPNKIRQYLETLDKSSTLGGSAKFIRVEYVSWGEIKEKEGILEYVANYFGGFIFDPEPGIVIIDPTDLSKRNSIPFLGPGNAIRKIWDERGEVLYENPLIPGDYNLKSHEVPSLMKKCFGEDWAKRYSKLMRRE
jgi:hypothetical protein